MWITVDKFCSFLTKERLFVDKILFFLYNLHKKSKKRKIFLIARKVIHLKIKIGQVYKTHFFESYPQKKGLFQIYICAKP